MALLQARCFFASRLGRQTDAAKHVGKKESARHRQHDRPQRPARRRPPSPYRRLDHRGVPSIQHEDRLSVLGQCLTPPRTSQVSLGSFQQASARHRSWPACTRARARRDRAPTVGSPAAPARSAAGLRSPAGCSLAARCRSQAHAAGALRPGRIRHGLGSTRARARPVTASPGSASPSPVPRASTACGLLAGLPATPAASAARRFAAADAALRPTRQSRRLA
jgi:hypothetical protein